MITVEMDISRLLNRSRGTAPPLAKWLSQRSVKAILLLSSEKPETGMNHELNPLVR